MGFGTRTCSHYQGHQRKPKGNQRKSLSSKGLRDNIKGNQRNTQLFKKTLKNSLGKSLTSKGFRKNMKGKLRKTKGSHCCWKDFQEKTKRNH